jgi:hypothetical protein
VKTPLALFCLLAPLAARADFEAIGFSRDDAYVAFVEHGTSEGRGTPWARLTILEVGKNARVGKPVESGKPPGSVESGKPPGSVESGKPPGSVESGKPPGSVESGKPPGSVAVELDPSGEARTEEDAVAQVKALAQPELLRLGITEAARSSKVDDKNGFGGDGWEEGVVQIATRPARKKKSRCAEPFKPLLLTISISQTDAEPLTLLSEKKAPKDRPCTGQCAPRRLYAHGKAVLVMGTCSAPGFEGAGEKLIAVAARLPVSLLSSP